MITDKDSLKKEGQCPCLKQAFARDTTLLHISAFAIRSLRCDYII
jgi:hypothetical protein